MKDIALTIGLLIILLFLVTSTCLLADVIRSESAKIRTVCTAQHINGFHAPECKEKEMSIQSQAFGDESNRQTYEQNRDAWFAGQRLSGNVYQCDKCLACPVMDKTVLPESLARWKDHHFTSKCVEKPLFYEFDVGEPAIKGTWTGDGEAPMSHIVSITSEASDDYYLDCKDVDAVRRSGLFDMAKFRECRTAQMGQWGRTLAIST